MLFNLELLLKDTVAQQLGITVINDCEVRYILCLAY
jgi:hypothetical protein